MDDLTLKAKIDQALKTAMLLRQAETVSVLRGVKSAILYDEVAQGKREVGLNDDEVQAVLAREAKKRQESADLYTQGGNTEKASQELSEKKIIETFLPAALSGEELAELVNTVVTGNPDAPMGQLIGLVKAQAGPTADGATIARLVKEKIAS